MSRACLTVITGLWQLLRLIVLMYARLLFRFPSNLNMYYIIRLAFCFPSFD